jgi:hypothetical protein
LDIKGKYTTYYGFTVMNSSSKRYSSQSGGSPTDISTNTGIHVDGPNNKLINLTVRDNVGVGIGFWRAATNSELYGNIIYNNGWQGSDRGHGHGIYAQNETTIKQIKDNIVYGGFGRGIQIYGVNGGITGFNIDGNTIFNNGLLSAGTFAVVIGGEVSANNITLRNNNTYKDASGNGSKGQNIRVHFGSVLNGKLTIENNNILGGELLLSIKNWKQVAFNGNNVVGKSKVIEFNAPSGSLGSYSWNNNTYVTSNSSNSMNGLTFDNWKKNTGLDRSSRFGSSAPNNQIIVRPNSYIKGTGAIIVYNHQRLSSIDVDISQIVPNGAEYEILDVENFTGQAVITGKYSGGTVRLPMTLTTTAKPNGVSSVPHSDQGFNTFVVRTKGKVTATSPVTVTNKQPTLNSISNPAAINEDAPEQTVNLSGITTGGESQTLSVTASSDNPGLIPNPTIQYSSPNTSGTLKFKPVANRFGTANITVTVNDGASSNNTLSRTFQVTVNCSPPAQPGSISGNTAPIQGSTQTYSVGTVSTATFYSWILPSGWSGTSETNSIEVTVGSEGGELSVVANNDCGSGGVSILQVIINSEEDVNIALNKPAYAFSESSSSNAGYAVDGKLYTSWESQWNKTDGISINLKNPYSINRVEIHWGQDFAKDFRIQTSHDAFNWTTVFTAKINNNFINDITEISGTGNYIRILGGKKSKRQNGYSISEIKVYGNPADLSFLKQAEIPEIKDHVIVYPNPAKEKVTIHIGNNWAQKEKIDLYSVTGKLIYFESIKGPFHTFDLSEMPKGLYIINISNSTSKNSYKFFIE